MHRLTASKIRSWLGCALLILSAVPHSLPPANATPAPATAEQIGSAIDRGLDYLHFAMTRPDATTGYWDTEYPEATTAMAVLAFEIQGHLASGNPTKDPYVNTVQRGLNYLLTTLRKQDIDPQPAGDPDTNANGYGLYAAVDDSELVIYTTGIVLMTLAVSGTPKEMAAVGGEGVLERTYRDIAQDMVDYLAWAQTDSPDAARGGWRYEPNSGDSDMSVTQWPVIGIEVAETNWGITVPDWIKSELGNYLTRIQDKDGGFGYRKDASDRKNIAKTGAGIACLLWIGVPADNERIGQAKDFIAARWDSTNDGFKYVENIGNLYAMYAVAKGSLLARPPIEVYGTHDWYQEYADYLISTQASNGSWNDETRVKGNLPLSTAWALLILSRTVLGPAVDLPGWLVLVPFALLPLPVLWWLLRAWRRHPPPRPPARPSRPSRPAPPPYKPSERPKKRGWGKDVTHDRPKRR